MNNSVVTKVSKQQRDTFIFPKFANKVYELIEKKYSQTYFVGGAVRDALLGKKIVDVDMATAATPAQVVAILNKQGIKYDDLNERFGVITAKEGKYLVEITTFRKDSYDSSRFPKVSFVKSPKTDSTRRDFTVNALYYSPIKQLICDYHGGLRDVKNKIIKFIGKTDKRIMEDPLRILRAHRFKLQLNFKFEKNTLHELHQHQKLLKKVSKNKIEKEILKTTSQKVKKQLQKLYTVSLD